MSYRVVYLYVQELDFHKSLLSRTATCIVSCCLLMRFLEKEFLEIKVKVPINVTSRRRRASGPSSSTASRSRSRSCRRRCARRRAQDTAIYVYMLLYISMDVYIFLYVAITVCWGNFLGPRAGRPASPSTPARSTCRPPRPASWVSPKRVAESYLQLLIAIHSYNSC